MRIEDKVAVVTGAASGIGHAVVRCLLDRGASAVAMVDLAAEVFSTARELNAGRDKDIAIPFQGDVTRGDFRRQVFQSLGEVGLPRICVPAAGILRDAMAVKLNKESGKAELYDEDLFRKVLEINLMHPVYWSMQMIAAIAEHRAAMGCDKWSAAEEIQGVAVIIGSVSSRGNKGQVSYSSAKSGLNAAAKTLNQEGAYFGIQTKIVHPGFVETPMVEQLPDGMFEQHIRRLVPIDRMIHPEEIANTVALLIENPAVSGPVWADGGFPPTA